MIKEKSYTNSVTSQHIKKLGQYFTRYEIADFMCRWACKNASSVLDPAVGNSVFLTFAQKNNPKSSLYGYEIDKTILDYFGNPTKAKIINENFLLNGWEDKYDAIICNPPYNRFQAVSNRSEILDSIYQHTGIKYSSYTNLYILFLIKSIYQLSQKGRLAFIIPSEFLNSKYGTAIKQLLLKNKLLRAVINFENDKDIFFNATTTCCIILLDKEQKDYITFYNISSISELTEDISMLEQKYAIRISFSDITAIEKWRKYIKQEKDSMYNNLKPISLFCSVSRGIATGANNFFCFTRSKLIQNNIPMRCFKKCICHSADVKELIFSNKDFEKLANDNKTVFLLDITSKDEQYLSMYINQGEKDGIKEKYLPSRRTPWYSMEQKKPAPIWVTSACRDSMRFVRNIAMVNTLTTFHSIYINDQYAEYVDIIFCYFITPIAQEIMRENRKELGSGLEKFQPNDLNNAKMLDITIIKEQDICEINKLYRQLSNKFSFEIINKLNSIFKKYLEI